MGNLIWLILVIVFWFNWDSIGNIFMTDFSLGTSANVEKLKEINIHEPLYKVNVDQIVKEFESNSITAEDKYLYKPIEVHGYITSIDDSMFNDNDVTISMDNGEEYSFDRISCNVTRSAQSVRELRKGMRVALRGVVVSEEAGVTLKKCAFYIFSEKRWV